MTLLQWAAEVPLSIRKLPEVSITPASIAYVTDLASFVITPSPYTIPASSFTLIAHKMERELSCFESQVPAAHTAVMWIL